MHIGIDLGGTKIEGLLLDANGDERDRRRVATPAASCERIVAAVAGLVAHLDPDSRATVGVGTPGTIVTTTGRMKNSNTTCLNGRYLPAQLEAALQRPVRVENDANCFALSEATDGAGKGAAVVFGVILGTGTGGGWVVHDRLITGPHGLAGEWGHSPMPWLPSGHTPRSCYCGKHDCVETYLCGPGLSLSHEQDTGHRLTAAKIAAAASGGDEQARSTLSRYVDQLARALTTVVHVIDPDVIVLGGGLSNVACLYESLSDRIEHWVFGGEGRTPVLPPRHGDSSGVRGAAWLGAGR